MQANLFEPLSERTPGEVFQELLRGEAFHLERIVSTGQSTPPGQWYDQPDGEWVVLLSGAARLTLTDPDETLELAPGDWLNIAPRRRHRVEWTDPSCETVWLALHYRADATRD